MRGPEGVLICAELNPAERDVADEMRQQTVIASDADLVRLGLWHLARHLDIPVEAEVFGMRRGQRARRTRTA